MFEISKQQVKLIKTSVPIENHGKEKKAAVVLTIEAIVHNKLLNLFANGLQDALYRVPSESESADLATEPGAPSVLRFGKMSPFEWNWTGTGYKATVDYGLGGDSDIELSDAKCDSFNITPLEGGSVNVRFNIIGHTDELHTGRLCFMQKQDINLTLTAPEPATVQELFGEQKAA